MVQYLRFVSFVVGLLLSLAAPGDSLALADGGMVTLCTLRSGQGLQEKTKMVDATGNIWLGGRKMGMKKVNIEVKGMVKTGKAKNSLNKSSGSSNAEDSRITTLHSGIFSLNKKTEGNALEPVNLSNSPQIKSQVFEASSSAHASLGSLKVVSGLSHGQVQTDETQRLLASTAEIFKMLQKDYHQHAHRRPPINNRLPLGRINVRP
ncbi:uncharacterized protein LOC120111293 [Phoenix dactylifera]|uniref:Uncharacterized protein LOC120111293 n=1 Tax=Phoenix dactylifera TaxID=42345 RepID=A0A8B9AIN8_PHODC|nr:uncharacterized protein LOC120111293 [Phoenix dactylifera]